MKNVSVVVMILVGFMVFSGCSDRDGSVWEQKETTESKSEIPHGEQPVAPAPDVETVELEEEQSDTNAMAPGGMPTGGVESNVTTPEPPQADETNATTGATPPSTALAPGGEVINGHVLPPEPDPKMNNATLLGVDVNDNGVRDDVERWIYKTYKDKHPVYVDIAMQAGRAYKKVLEMPEKAKEIHDEVDKVVYCQLYYKYDAKYFGDSILINQNSIDENFRSTIYFNTHDRMEAYNLYDALLSGDSYTLVEGKEQKAMCDFNTSKYDE